MGMWPTPYGSENLNHNGGMNNGNIVGLTPPLS
jgi:hypothetical protein